MTLRTIASSLILMLLSSLVVVAVAGAPAQRLPDILRGKGLALPGGNEVGAYPSEGLLPSGTLGKPLPPSRGAVSERVRRVRPPDNPIFLQTPTLQSGGFYANSVAVADLNGDGKLDLVVANECAIIDCSSGNVSILLGNGDGTFQAAQTYGSGGKDVVAVTVGDLNGDGRVDVVVANECGQNGCNGSVGVLLGNGDGTFQGEQTYASGGRYAASVAVGDADGDGKADVVVANQCANKSCDGGVGVLLGNGDGTLQGVHSYRSGGGYAVSVAMKDVNGDGRADILVANQCNLRCTAGGVGVLLGNGDGTFQGPVTYSSGGLSSFSVAVGDVNGDGSTDLLVANDCAALGCAGGSVGVLLGNGDGTFAAAQAYPSGGLNSYSVAVGDVNGDGKADLTVANECTNSSSCYGNVGVLLGNGDGTFQAVQTYASFGEYSLSVAMADVNGDSDTDLVVVNRCADSSCRYGNLAVLLGNGDGSFQAVRNYASGGLDADSVAVADVNGDGNADLIVVNECGDGSCNGGVGVLVGNGDGTFQGVQNYPSGGLYAYSVAVADVNGDGKSDFMVANRCTDSDCSAGSVGVLLGNGDGTFQVAQTYASGGLYAFSVAAADTNADGNADLVVANACTDIDCGGGSVGVLLGNGDGTFQVAQAYASGGLYSYSVAAADVSGDGIADLMVVNECSASDCNGGSVGVLLGNGDGTFLPVQNYASGGHEAFSATVKDVNGDGKADLLVANYCLLNDCSAGSLGVLLGNGDGTFQAAQAYASGGQGAYSMTLADFNHDGDADIVVANSSGTTGMLLGNGDGTFQNATAYKPGGLSVASGDFNNDQRPDVVLVSGSAVTPLLNVSTGFQQSTTTTLTSSVNPSSFNQAVTFTATVSATGPGTPTGTVTFFDASNLIGSGTLSNGIATLTLSTLNVGSHSITAVYGGDNNFLGSISSPMNQVVNPAATTTSLSSSPNPVVVTEPVTFTATITAQFGGAPTGTVTFMTKAKVLGTSPVSGGIASLTTHFDSPGTRVVTATYSGDANFAGSSGVVHQQVIKAASTTTLTSSPNPSQFQQPVVFTATVSTEIGTPPDGEIVTFLEGTTVLGTGSTLGGVATFSTSSLSHGTHKIKAKYPGDSTVKPSTSAVVEQKVN